MADKEITKFQIKCALKAKALWNIAEGTTVQPAERTTDYDTWVRKDAQAMFMLTASMDLNQIMLIENCETSKEILNKLDSIYLQKTETNKMIVHERFHQYKMSNTDTIAQHIAKVENLAKQVKEAGETMSNAAIMMKIISTLPTKYRNFRQAWLSMDETKQTISNLTARLLDEEKSLTAFEESEALAMLNRTVFIWEAKDLLNKDRKSLRINVEFDYATHVRWSPDCKAFIIHRFNENCLEVYKVDKKKDGWLTASKAITFSKSHETDVIGMGIASNGKFIMTCSNKTDMVIWDLKGEKLAKTETFLMNTTCAKISPCGRFVVASGFTPEAKTWDVVFDKSGEFRDIKQIPQLTLGGHSSGVYDVAFDVDSSHMATVSKDGTWRIFDTNVNYKQGQDARLDKSGKYELAGGHSLIALSPNSEVIVIAAASDLQFFSALTGELDYTIENISDENITALLFDASGKHLFVASDKHIRIFHNVTGYRCTIAHSKEKLKEHQTSATRERLHQLIKDSEEFLINIGEK